MKTHPVSHNPVGTLSRLSVVPLAPRQAALLAAAEAGTGGSAVWRGRKRAEALDLCRLVELSGRLGILGVDLSVDLRADLLLKVPVPCLPDPQGPLKVADAAHLGVVYREAALIMPQPGYSFVQILAPHPVWHPNVSPDPAQILCLGPSVPAGIPLREIILMTYGALTMMSLQLDPADAAGVLNPAAAEWFQRNPGLIPLSRDPFVLSAKPSL